MATSIFTYQEVAGGVPTARSASEGLMIPSRKIRITIIGGGAGVEHIVTELREAGHVVSVHPFGAHLPAGYVADACRDADVVFSILPDEMLVEAATLAPGGIVQSLPRDAIHIGLSKIGVACSDRLVEAHWNAARSYVAAPILVQECQAPAGISIIAGGRKPVLSQVRKLLRTIGNVIAEFDGWPTQANRMHLRAMCSG